VKINFTSLPCVPNEDLERNEAYAKSLGLPRLGEAQHPYLAIVGGGPSAQDHLEELRDWPGEIWAINGTYKWLRDNGVLSAFFTIDPKPGIAEMTESVDCAVLATCCHPSAFDAAFHAHVETIDLADYPCGPTTASSAPMIALKRGHKQVSFFGCEGNFGATTHAYENREMPILEVVCNGQTFRTNPQMLQQSEYLAEQIRVAPQVLIDRSGGLLSAVVADPDIDVTAASRSIYDAVMAA
jgi:hypothetical protein